MVDLTSMPNEKLVCRVCGLVQAEPPWGEDEATPSFDICDCCGVEFGYEDATRPAVVRYRAAWIKAGARWHNPRMRPAAWDLDRQLTNVPARWRA